MALIINIRQLQRIAKKVGRKYMHREPSVKSADGLSSYWCVTDYFNQCTYHLDKRMASMDQVRKCCGFENHYYDDGTLSAIRIEHVSPLTRHLRNAAWSGWHGISPNSRKFLKAHGVSEEQAETMHRLNTSRMRNRWHQAPKSHSSEVIDIVNYFKDIPFMYQGDGMDDFNKFQRPSSNGIGYVAICPGEPGNNFYTEDPVAVKILTRKFNRFKDSHPEFKANP